jgi:EpsI family protein
MLNRAIALFVVFLVASGVIARAQRTERIPERQQLSALPMTFNGWQGRVDPPMSEKELKILGADDVLLRTYSGPGKIAGLYIGFWESQKRGDAAHSPLNCLPGAGWQPLSTRHLQVAVDGSKNPIEVNRVVIQKGLDRQLVLYWYQSHGRVVASEYWGKFYLVADAVRLSRSDTAIVRVVVPTGDLSAEGEDKAERNAVDFVQRLFPALSNFVPS